MLSLNFRDGAFCSDLEERTVSVSSIYAIPHALRQELCKPCFQIRLVIRRFHEHLALCTAPNVMLRHKTATILACRGIKKSLITFVTQSQSEPI